MTDSAPVQSFERITDENGEAVEVKVDPVDGPLLTIENFPPCGDDAPPLSTDNAAIKEATGTGTAQAVGYQDPKNKGKALGGEKRMYGRAPDGTVAAEIWIHGDGLVEITALAAGGRYKIGKVEIDADGNLTTPGEITAKVDTTPVKLSTHIHPTPSGPSSPPTPGT